MLPLLIALVVGLLRLTLLLNEFVICVVTFSNSAFVILDVFTGTEILVSFTFALFIALLLKALYVKSVEEEVDCGTDLDSSFVLILFDLVDDGVVTTLFWNTLFVFLNNWLFTPETLEDVVILGVVTNPVVGTIFSGNKAAFVLLLIIEFDSALLFNPFSKPFGTFVIVFLASSLILCISIGSWTLLWWRRSSRDEIRLFK